MQITDVVYTDDPEGDFGAFGRVDPYSPWDFSFLIGLTMAYARQIGDSGSYEELCGGTLYQTEEPSSCTPFHFAGWVSGGVISSGPGTTSLGGYVERIWYYTTEWAEWASSLPVLSGGIANDGEPLGPCGYPACAGCATYMVGYLGTFVGPGGTTIDNYGGTSKMRFSVTLNGCRCEQTGFYPQTDYSQAGLQLCLTLSGALQTIGACTQAYEGWETNGSSCYNLPTYLKSQSHPYMGYGNAGNPPFYLLSPEQSHSWNRVTMRGVQCDENGFVSQEFEWFLDFNLLRSLLPTPNPTTDVHAGTLTIKGVIFAP